MPDPKLVSSSLGRGLGDLMRNAPASRTLIKPGEHGFLKIPVADIAEPPGPASPEPDDTDFLQTVRKLGILQPLLVRPAETGYALVAGRRRLRAARAAGLATVPARVLDIEDGALDAYREADNLRGKSGTDEPSHVAIAVRAIKTPAIAVALLIGLIGGWALCVYHYRDVHGDLARKTAAAAEEGARPPALDVPLRWRFAPPR